jgi:hypothetical protein
MARQQLSQAQMQQETPAAIAKKDDEDYSFISAMRAAQQETPAAIAKKANDK